MNDETKRSILNDILNRVGLDSIGQVVIEQNNTINVGKEQPVQMPPYLLKERAMELYLFLVDGCYIEAQTSADDFLYLMGVTSVAPMRLKRINWLRTMQQLRRMLELAFEVPISRGSLKKAEIERRAPECFLNKGNKIEKLSKATEEFSSELDAIEHFFRPK